MQISTTIIKSSTKIPQQLKNRTVMWSNYTTPGHISKQTDISLHIIETFVL
jgi:hypothetical protein